MKYNIAFIPRSNQAQFVNYANESHKISGSGNYLLGEKSIPHVSLCHFECEPHALENIWKEIENLNITPLNLIFNEIRSKLYPDHPKWGGVSWVSLISNHLDILKDIHLKVADIIKEPLNASFAQYDPHLTLLNSYNEAACLIFNEKYQLQKSLVDDFIIALGPIDNNGQLLEIIKQIEFI